MSELTDNLSDSILIVAENRKLKKLTEVQREEIRELRESNANLRARINFDLPALLRRQGE